MVVELVDKDRADGVHDNNRVVAVASNSVDHVRAVVPQGEIVAIALVSINNDVTFTSITVGKDNASTAYTWLRDTGSQSSGLVESRIVNDRFDRALAASDFGLDCLEGCNEVWEVGSSRAPAHRQRTIVAATVATSVWTQPFSVASEPNTVVNFSVLVRGSAPLFFKSTVPIAA